MYEYRCKVVKIIDGDTVDVDIDLGFGVWMHKERVRLFGIDTPESRTRDLEEKNIDNDYKYSRDTYYELVEKGKQSLELMIEVARESEHPRAFEVLSGMIKNISDVNDRLMDLNKKKKDIDKKDEVKKIANTTNNLFVGSTTELQKLLKNESEIVNVTPKPE